MKENEVVETINKIIEKQEDLENRISLLEIIAKKTEVPSESQQTTKKVIQINANGKTYFCETPVEQNIFAENNPGVTMETFNLDMPTFIADKHLNDPENKKQFIRKDK